MSVEVMTMVFKRYPNGGGEMLLALALADHSSDDGSGIYPSIKSLADKTRQSERSVQYQLRRMEEAGWIILVNSGNGGRNQRREYRISPDWIKGAEIAPPEKGAIHDAKGAPDNIKGAIGDAKGCNGLHPHITVNEPSEEPSITIKAKRKRSPVFDAESIALPDWLPSTLWARWVKHRGEIKKPITEETARSQIGKLTAYRADGWDPTTVVDHCIAGGYQGLFPPHGQPNGSASPARPGKFDPSGYVNRNRTRPQSPPDHDDGTIDV